MTKLLLLSLTWIVAGSMVLPAFGANKHYPSNREPLVQLPFTALPVGAVKPTGWLRDQLIVQANGLTGHLDEFWPSLTDSKWKGGNGEGWERAPYYLDGLVPLAYILEDQRLIDKVKGWMEAMIASAQPNGWFGPRDNGDRWPLAVALKVLTQYHEATGDERALKVIEGYCKFLRDNPPDWPSKDWRGMRAMETAVSIYWLYNRTGDRYLLDVARSIQENSFDWTDYFLDFPYPKGIQEMEGVRPGHPTHVVNIAMGTKYPGLWWQQSKDDRFKQAVYEGLAALDDKHGQVGGRFCGDEHLCGRKPTQGTELCAIVEYMFSMEKLVETFGDPAFADRLEMLAYNANPGTCTADYWAHQYDQQANQVLVSVAKRAWTTNSDDSNVYGLEPNYGCCTANMHQGWPKFVAHLWMASADNGLAAIAYGPSQVKARVGESGVEATITETTDYPWNGRITLTVDVPAETQFPLHLRVPGWAEGARMMINDGDTVNLKPGAFVRLDRKWNKGDSVELVLPMKIRTEARYNGAVSILRGPIYYSLRIGEKYTKIKQHDDTLPAIDWQIEPTTPWNYGLLIDPTHPDRSIRAELGTLREKPFDHAYPPVILRVKGKQIPEWKLEHNQAGETPRSPVKVDGPPVDLELIPYGNTRLRITEFPVIAE